MQLFKNPKVVSPFLPFLQPFTSQYFKRERDLLAGTFFGYTMSVRRLSSCPHLPPFSSIAVHQWVVFVSSDSAWVRLEHLRPRAHDTLPSGSLVLTMTTH